MYCEAHFRFPSECLPKHLPNDEAEKKRQYTDPTLQAEHSIQTA